MKIQHGIVERDGFKLEYIIEGTGEPILIIGSRIYYQRLFSPELRKTNQLIFVDHRGFTPPPATLSEDISSAYTLDKIVDDIEAVRNHLALDKIWIMGHSGNGFLALEYTKKYEDAVSGLILVSVSPSFSLENHAITDLHFDTIAEPERMVKFRENIEGMETQIAEDPANKFKWLNLAYAPKGWKDVSFDAAPLWDDVYTNMPAIDYLWREVFRDIDITTNLEHFYIPVWLGIGKFDFIVGPKEQWDSITKHFQDLTIEQFEQSAHNPPYEEAELFNQKLLQWMELYK